MEEKSGVSFKQVNKLYNEFSLMLDELILKKDLGGGCQVKEDDITSKADEIIKEVEAGWGQSEKGTDEWIRGVSMKAHVDYGLAKAEMAKGEQGNVTPLLQKTYDTLFEQRLHPYLSYLYFFTVNNLCYCLQKENKLSEARSILAKMCEDYEALGEGRQLNTCSEVFGEEPEDSEDTKWGNFETIFTKNLQMLAYLSDMEGDRENVGRLYHVVLSRQLGNTEPLIWAQRALNLANYFTTQCSFKEALVHLMAADKVLEKLQESPQENEVNVEEGRCKAEVAMGWVLYCLNLLSLSKHLIQTENKIEPRNEPDLGFPGLKLDNTGDKVASEPVTDPAQAKALCQLAMEKVTEAKRFLNFHQYPENYVACCLSESDIYKSMCFFETEFDEEYTLCRKRQEILEEVGELCRNLEQGDLHVEVTRQLVDTHMRIVSLQLVYLTALTDSSSEGQVANTLEELVTLENDVDQQPPSYVTN